MDITLSKSSATDGLIKVTLSAMDYQPKVEEKIRDYARKATIKGFRQGKVPGSIIKKMYGKSILVEEVNHLLSHSLSDYIKANNLNVLGEPIPNTAMAAAIDWDIQKDFEFEFQIGMAEDFQYDLSPAVKLNAYHITVDEETINSTLADIKKRFGAVTQPETSEAGDTLHGEAWPAGGAEPARAHLEIAKDPDEAQALFVGRQVSDQVEFDIRKIFPSQEAIAQFLGIAPDEAQNVAGNYIFKVNAIHRVAPAELNQELFDKVFGPEVVQSNEAFLAKIKETIGNNYQREADQLLELEIQRHFIQHTTIHLPDNFLKNWLKFSSHGKITDAVLEAEFNQYRDSLKWDLIQNRIAEDHQIAVETEEVKNKAKEMIMGQFGGQAFAAQLGDRLDAIADNYLSGNDGKNFMTIYNQLRREKIMGAIRQKISFHEKTVSLAEFNDVVKNYHA